MSRFVGNLKDRFSRDEAHIIYLTLTFASLVVPSKRLSNTIGLPPVRGDDLRALVSGLSYVQMDKHGITIL